MLVRRLAEPIWDGFDDKTLAAKALVLRSLAAADPFGVLRKLDDVDPAGAREKSIIQARLVPMLAPLDPDQAIVAAEGRSSPSARAMSLRQVVDALPEMQRARKLAILDRIVTQAKAATTPRVRLTLMVDVAERWVRWGTGKGPETARRGTSRHEPGARAARPGARPFRRQLARFDLPSALAIAREFPATGTYTARGAIRLIAFHLAADNPAEAERVLRQVPQEAGKEWFPPIMALKMAAIDPARCAQAHGRIAAPLQAPAGIFVPGERRGRAIRRPQARRFRPPCTGSID